MTARRENPGARRPLVLIVDDERAIRDMTQFALGRASMEVNTAANAREALLRISEQRPDIVLLDWMMPGVSGIELTRRLRRDALTADIPIIILTAKIGEDDKVTGFEAGADDYVSKPFSPRELVARIRAVLRRTSPADQEGRITAGGLVLDTRGRRVLSDLGEVSLGPTEFRLLEFFMSNQGRAYNRTQILDHVWGTNAYLEERTVDVHIRRLRKALAPTGHSHCVQTVRGFGYRFIAE
jgi:two-component system phosphate regulon response regulator PhoB